MTGSRTQLPAWQALREHHRAAQGFHLRELIERDAARYEKCSFRSGGILFDYSKHLVTDETLRLLVELARQCDLPAWIERLFSGERINTTENRAALHTALRSQEPVVLDGRNVVADVEDELSRIRRFCEDVWNAKRHGSTGRAFTDVVNIGIGGSDLGPAFVTEALVPYARPHPRLHFVSNVDGAHLSGVLGDLDPETTLFLVASKTFTTLETLANARSARTWLAAKLGGGTVARHFAAITANPAAAREFGADPDAVFEFWDWVGGRYSLWSAVGLPVALAIGVQHFDALRRGAREMDEHFRRAPLERNVPVLAGLLGVWYIDFFGAAAHAVLPYDQRLKRLPDYLQQLEMESNGKRVTRDGATVDYATAPVIFGAAGTNGQHAFYQLLHQGTLLIPADFIACCRPHHALEGHHPALLANYFAQTEALARGKTTAEAEAEMRARRMTEDHVAKLLPHRVCPGNRPTTSILLDQLDPHALGALIAFYEHKTFVQSVIWNVNAFDQWGVELGKELAGRLLTELEGEAPVSSHDASTNGLINHFKAHRQHR
ncbi:MAG: glucose-6-phosphate isomerase [Betaproteobacteria bacterium RIFCSPLOWO2_12_FULL_62_13]|nr:MAG: glucose-6-phosphate isomerase [Betaproteobacteria bacterium RIFCSPLOWO2_12_FULL_62_13]